MRAVLFLTASIAFAADWVPLFNGKNLDGWTERGDGVWTVVDGVLTGQRNPRAQPPTTEWPLDEAKYQAWVDRQAWLYTASEFEEYDLTFEYWLRATGNSGVALHDPSRGEHGLTAPPNYRKTPSKIAYEIQLNNQYPDPHPSGSIYGIAKARTGPQRDNQWNRMDIEVRRERIRVRINGEMVAEAATDPARPQRGPIGLQLHDVFSFVMFRDVRIRKLP